jgi:hypothetical protein
MDFNRPSVTSNAIIFMNLNPSEPMTMGQNMSLSTMAGGGTIVHQIKLILDKFILAHGIKAYECAGIAPFINFLINLFIYSCSMDSYRVTEPCGYRNR